MSPLTVKSRRRRSIDSLTLRPCSVVMRNKTWALYSCSRPYRLRISRRRSRALPVSIRHNRYLNAISAVQSLG